ncbi:MAG: helix-turn-helix domain-containing protein [Spirochaetales bacterium]|nr:helix-turn-helix domain-containing protein [Spirochaetales bacterium]
MTQSQLAEKINISYQQLQKYEKGESQIGLQRYLEIAKALETAPHVLLEKLISQNISEPEIQYTSDKTQQLKVTPEEKKLIAYFRNIKDKEVKNNLIKLFKSVSESDSQEE